MSDAVGQARKAIVLLSGGLDSTTVLAIAQSEGFECHAISFQYGQRHKVELDRAREIARRMGVARHVVVDFDLRRFGGSALTSHAPIPKDRSIAAMADGIPVTYVPARNTIFLALALAYAEVTDSEAIFTGVNAIDYSGYPDCRPEFMAAFEKVANLATRRAVEGRGIMIEAPIMRMSKAEIIRRGHALGVDFALTVSCYSADGQSRACGRCDACRFRKEGFAAAGVPDPTHYRG